MRNFKVVPLGIRGMLRFAWHGAAAPGLRSWDCLSGSFRRILLELGLRWRDWAK